MNMDFEIEFSEEKNQLLKETRGICFEDVIELIQKKLTIGDVKHHNQKRYRKQRIFIISFKNYAYVIPYVIDKNKKTIFLKTIYPSRRFKKKYEKKL